jgi:hypothetical protein
MRTLLAIAIPAILTVAVIAVWLWLRSASPQPPGQHRRPADATRTTRSARTARSRRGTVR